MLEPTSGAPGRGADHPYRWAVLAGVWLAYFSFGLMTVTIAPLVRVIGTDLGLSHSRMGIVLGAWQMTFVAAAIPCGILLERIGTRRAILLALIVFAVSGVLRSAAVGHVSLFLAVTMFGLGAPMISIGSPKLISQWFQGRDRGLAMGIYVSGPFLGNITGLSMTNGALMPLFNGNWRFVMLAYAGFIVVTSMAWLTITAHPEFSAAERCLAAEKREKQVDTFKRLIGVPAVRIVLLMVFGIFIFNHTLTNWLPEILQSRGLDAATAGYWASTPTAVAILSALTIPRFATPERRIRILFGLFVLAGVATLLLHIEPGSLLAGGLVCQGLARGAMMTVTILTLLEIPGVGTKRAGMAGSLFFSTAEFGGVVGPMSMGVISDFAGFDVALNVLSGICAVLIALLFILRRNLA